MHFIGNNGLAALAHATLGQAAMQANGMRATALLCIGLLGGCVGPAMVPPTELIHLDGYDVHGEATEERCASHPGTDIAARNLITTDGEVARFSDETPLYLIGKDGLPAGGRFATIKVTDKEFAGTLTDGTTVEKSLGDVSVVQVGDDQRPTEVLATILTLGLLTLLVVEAARHPNADVR